MLLRQNSVLRVLIVDDHELTRFTLQLALQNQKNIALVGLASNGLEAIAMVEKHHPDVIILDLQMPVMDGIAASKQIKSIAPETQILAYSSVEDPQVEVMVQTGRIDAFCQKDISTQELIETIGRLGEKLVSH
jgi:DNA-binding NarL/FixJ family response regulator